MQAIASVSLEAVSVVAVMGLMQLCLLAFRNPHRPSWLRGGGAEAFAATAIVAAISFSIAFLIAGLTWAGLDAFVAMFLGLGVAGGSSWLIWRLFGVSERLRRAEAGRSPFEPLTPKQRGGTPGQIGGQPAS